MSRAELPENLHQAADEIMRRESAQHPTSVMHLSELERMFADPDYSPVSTETSVSSETVAVTPFNELTKIQQLKALSSLDVAARTDPELKTYLDMTFPNGYSQTEPSLRMYTWEVYKTEQNKSKLDKTDEAVLEAQRYQMRQLDIRRINAGRDIWAQKVTDEMVEYTNEQVQNYYLRDETEAYLEYDQREIAQRTEIVTQRAKQDLETYLAIDVFVKACEAAGYSVNDFKTEKPEYAVISLRSLLAEWQKNGVVEPKPTALEDMSAPLALAVVRKALRAHRGVKTESKTAEISHQQPVQQPSQADVQTGPLSAGARTYDAFPGQGQITSVTLAALKGEVTATFPIDHPTGVK